MECPAFEAELLRFSGHTQQVALLGDVEEVTWIRYTRTRFNFFQSPYHGVSL
jgi:hypothetical protein